MVGTVEAVDFEASNGRNKGLLFCGCFMFRNCGLRSSFDRGNVAFLPAYFRARSKVISISPIDWPFGRQFGSPN